MIKNPKEEKSEDQLATNGFKPLISISKLWQSRITLA